jgi:hypothetical protein
MLSNPGKCPGTHHWQRCSAIETFQDLLNNNSVRFSVEGEITGKKAKLWLFFRYAEPD